MVSNTNRKIIVPPFLNHTVSNNCLLMSRFHETSSFIYLYKISDFYQKRIERMRKIRTKQLNKRVFVKKTSKCAMTQWGWEERGNDCVYTLVGLSCVSLHTFTVWQIRHNCNDYCPTALCVISQLGSRLICWVWWPYFAGLWGFRIRCPTAIFQKHVRHPWSCVHVRAGNKYV